MKKLITLLTTLSLLAGADAQSITTTSTVASNLPITGGRNWSISGTTATASILNNGANYTDYLYLSGFDFSSLPVNAVISSFSVTITRSAQATVVDSAVRLHVGGAPYYAPNTNAASSPTTWSTTPTAFVYSFIGGALSNVTAAQLKAADFGILLSTRKVASNIISAEIITTVTINMTYTVLLPMILTEFTVTKNTDNLVEIKFSSSVQGDVDKLVIERSTDGKNFQPLFIIPPAGARNVYTKYAMVDKTPAQGANYYRLAELRLDGKWYYYTTKMINMSRKGHSFQTYYNGGQVVANISTLPGQYEVSLMDMAGITIAKKTTNLNSGTGQIIFDAPARTGIYLVTLKGHGYGEITRVSILR